MLKGKTMIRKLVIWAAAAAALCFALPAGAGPVSRYVDRSGTIATGGTSQTLAPAYLDRRVIIISHATTETEPLCVNVGAAASCTAGNSFMIAPGGSLQLDTQELITVVAATTGHKYVAKEGAENVSLTNGGSATISGGGDASAANQVTANNSLSSISTAQTDGSQKSQIVDGSGNVIGATSNALDVNIKSGASSGAVAQGSTTSGQTGGLTQAAVTTAAPTYTTGQTNPLSLNTSGGLRVDGSAVTQPVSAASLPLPSGAATAAKQPALGTAGASSTDVITVQGIASGTALPVSAAQFPPAVGAQTPANSLATFNAASAGAQTSVADSATDATCLASNAARKGASLYNDSTVTAYVLLANATSSATAFTVKLVAEAYYEVPYSYTGVIKCIWASDASGSMRVTEFTN